jgi:hypothetical protein
MSLDRIGYQQPSSKGWRIGYPVIPLHQTASKDSFATVDEGAGIDVTHRFARLKARNIAT